MAEINRSWYKEMAVYQVWPRSFCDGNGDGIGDLKGVLSKLDYIKSLGVDAIWFSPLYVSPQKDYGYDIADYRNIQPEYGTLEDFKAVLDGAHERGIRPISTSGSLRVRRVRITPITIITIGIRVRARTVSATPTTGCQPLQAEPGSMTKTSRSITFIFLLLNSLTLIWITPRSVKRLRTL